MSETIRIVLPWPPVVLSPNSREHWRKVAKAKKSYRSECGWQALKQGAKALNSTGLTVSLTFIPPTRRRHDLDNLLARMKSGLDGIADVIKVDDSKWQLLIKKEDRIGGYVIVEIIQ